MVAVKDWRGRVLAGFTPDISPRPSCRAWPTSRGRWSALVQPRPQAHILSPSTSSQVTCFLPGTAPPGVMSTTHSALSHVLNCLLNQSDASSTVGKDTPTLTLAQPHAKVTNQQHIT